MTCAQNRRSQAFDDEALEHLRTLKKVSRRLARNPSEAEDLVQDAYVNAFRAADRFGPGSNLRAWLWTILTNLGKNRRRESLRARVHANEEAVARATAHLRSGEASPEEQLLNAAMAPRLQAALESMPKALRDTVWLRDVEEFSYAEIAQRLRIPVGTVMSRISRGRRQLHAQLVARDHRRPSQ